MATLDLTVRDMAGDLEVDVSVPLEGGSSVDQLVSRLVALLKWPRLDSAGHAVQYVVLDPRTHLAYVGTRTIGETGLMRAMTVVLAPAARKPS
ncbi:MAG TPA: hypothetical protein VKV73_01170 [Chloroflexota bacterium]|nr:hypothetical protein [Chloroflexota bacterium]